MKRSNNTIDSPQEYTPNMTEQPCQDNNNNTAPRPVENEELFDYLFIKKK